MHAMAWHGQTVVLCSCSCDRSINTLNRNLFCYTQWPLTGELLCNFYGLEPLGVALHCAMDENEFVHGEAEFRLHFTAVGLLRLWNSTLGHTVRTQGQVHRRESSTGAHAAFFWHICNGISVTLVHEDGR